MFGSMTGVFLFPFFWVGQRPESFSGSFYKAALSCANCVSGGVFIATFFIGLMPEVRYMFHETFQTYQIQLDFPITELVIFLGFILALSIEQIVLERQERKSGVYTTVPSHSSEAEDNIKKQLEGSKKRDATKIPVDTTETERSSSDNDSDIQCKQSSSLDRHLPNTDYSDHNHNHGHSHVDISHMLQSNAANIRLGLLIVSLGVHSLFEGLALGLQTEVPTLVNLVIGVAMHELLVAFAMGVNVSRLKVPTSTALKLAVIFSASIPCGQLLGLLIGHYQSTTGQVISAVLQGLATGTFIHVTFLEVIPSEFQEKGNRLLKVLFLFLGFMVLFICTVLMKSILHIEH